MVSRARLTSIAAVALVLVAVGALAVLAVLALGSDSGGSASDSELADQISVAVKQYRRDQARRVVQVTVTNHGPTPITVERLQLDTTGFSAIPPSAPGARINAGDLVDLPAKLGESRCGTATTTAIAPSAGSASVIAWVRAADGSPAVEVRLSLPDPIKLLDRIRTLECRQRALARVVNVGFGKTWALGTAYDRPALFGDIRIDRRPGGSQPPQPVTVADLAGSVIFGLSPATPEWTPPVRLDPATPGITIPIKLIVERCDGHALADSKRTFFFPLWISLSDEPQIYLTITPNDDARKRMEALIRVACHLDG